LWEEPRVPRCIDFQVHTWDTTHSGTEYDGRIACDAVIGFQIYWNSSRSGFVQVGIGNVNIWRDTDASSGVLATFSRFAADLNEDGHIDFTPFGPDDVCSKDVKILVQEAGSDGCNNGVLRHIDPTPEPAPEVFFGD
jgi:hypothetical protein